MTAHPNIVISSSRAKFSYDGKIKNRSGIPKTYYIAIVFLVEFIFSGLIAELCHTFCLVLWPPSNGFRSNTSAFCIGVVYWSLYLFLSRSSGVYALPSTLNKNARVFYVVGCAAVAFAMLYVVLFIVASGNTISHWAFLLFAIAEVAFLVLSRLISRVLAAKLVELGALAGEPAVIIGDAAELAKLGRQDLMREFGFDEVGRVSIDPSQTKVGEYVDAIIELCRCHCAKRIAILMRWDAESLTSLREDLRRSALPATLLPDTNIRRLAGGDVKSLEVDRHLPSIDFQRAPLSQQTLLCKRLIDVGVACAVLILLSPLMVLIALAIKVESRGPIIFKQRRYGFDRRPFNIFKFRSMRVIEDGPDVVQACRGDARVTRVGRAIRKTSIDELPQLFNVLRGEMSLVGPRPHAVSHDDAYSLLIERYFFRHHVKPGITGWAQTSGARGQTPAVENMRRRIEYDLWYIDNYSLSLDFIILFKTVRELFRMDAF